MIHPAPKPARAAQKQAKTLQRSKPIPRTSRVKPVNRKRRAKNVIRANGSEQRILWVQSQPCIVTGRTPCEVVHVKTGGMSRKADACWTVPMIAVKHRELHRIGVRSFEAKYHVDLGWMAHLTDVAWNEYQQAHVASLTPENSHG